MDIAKRQQEAGGLLSKEDADFVWMYALHSTLTTEEYGRQSKVSSFNSDGEIQILENRKKGLKNKHDKLLELRLNEEISKEKFHEAQGEIEDKITKIEEQIAQLEAKEKLDYKMIDEVLSLTTNIYQTYIDASDFLKRHYLKLFFERIYVKDRKIWKVAENPIFSVLREQAVIISGQVLAKFPSGGSKFSLVY